MNEPMGDEQTVIRACSNCGFRTMCQY